MNNTKRVQNYLKQKKTSNEECLTFRQKRRIRKHEKKLI
jgi:hypothetical protein